MSLSRGAIAGIAVGSVVIFFITFNTLLYLWVKRTKGRHSDHNWGTRYSVGSSLNPTSGISGSKSTSTRKPYTQRTDRSPRFSESSIYLTSYYSVSFPEPTYHHSNHGAAGEVGDGMLPETGGIRDGENNRDDECGDRDMSRGN
ncbi:hypothetical protein GYMLUDRAFT_776144 [Collybiopsis luxurians FD-317 M1]|uniref:Uncharacterized protein n=1 Tax=Collybiopsis luxurians FD-317 M1 TaxID=944289 RepID=A0A0D0CFK2_9AGAR|nr:hypothetical protein GYMLUDRAFT_776144 [Collybiopsis luxurians FD-317 M1]